MIAIVDYGVGNLFSLKSSFAKIGQNAVVTGEIKTIEAADKIILPGVGAFSDAAEKLNCSGLCTVVKEQAASGKPLMGICLGMQLLFDKSFENGESQGLSIIEGQVVPIERQIEKGLKIPQIGWNALAFTNESPIFRYIKESDYVYFVHSYYADTPAKYVTATTDYGGILTAAVQKNNVFGCQFHPEKSGDVGLKILKAFCEL